MISFIMTALPRLKSEIVCQGVKKYFYFYLKLYSRILL